MEKPAHSTKYSRAAQWGRGLGAFAMLSSIFLTPLAMAADSPELKAIMPKVDTSTPADAPKKMKLLQGSLIHTDEGKALAPLNASTAKSTAPKLSAGATNNSAKGGAKNWLGPLLKGKNDNNVMKAKVKDDTLRAEATSGFGIIGVKFVLTSGRPPIINRVFPGTPAWEKGLKDDDKIVAVDGVPTMGLSKEEVYDLIIGSPGTLVALTIMRDGGFMRTSCMRMDINEIRDPLVRRDYMTHM